MTPLQAMKRAAQCMSRMLNDGEWYNPRKILDDLFDAIEEMEKAEPVAWMSKDGSASQFAHPWVVDPKPLYTHPVPIPEGWQLVPVEPTQEMLDAGLIGDARYARMLAAAPKEPT